MKCAFLSTYKIPKGQDILPRFFYFTPSIFINLDGDGKVTFYVGFLFWLLVVYSKKAVKK